MIERSSRCRFHASRLDPHSVYLFPAQLCRLASWHSLVLIQLVSSHARVYTEAVLLMLSPLRRCSKTQPCTNCVRRNEECVWLGEQPPLAASQLISVDAKDDAPSPVNRIERLRIESSDADQRFRVAVSAISRYILGPDYIYMMMASSFNDTHVTVRPL
jgi:hypothetical protein